MHFLDKTGKRLLLSLGLVLLSGLLVFLRYPVVGALYITGGESALSELDCGTAITTSLLGVDKAHAAQTADLPGLADYLRKNIGKSTDPIAGLPGGGIIPPNLRCARTLWTIGDQFGLGLPQNDRAQVVCDGLSKRPGTKIGPGKSFNDPLPSVGKGDAYIICLTDGDGHVGHVAWVIGLPAYGPGGGINGWLPAIVGNSQGQLIDRSPDYWKQHGYKGYKIITL